MEAAEKGRREPAAMTPKGVEPFGVPSRVVRTWGTAPVAAHAQIVPFVAPLK